MRVALTVARHSVTGVPRVQVRLAKELARRGFAVDLVVLGPWPVGGLNQDVRLVKLGSGRAASAFPRLVGYMRRARPAAIISAEDHVNVITLLAARVSGTRVRVCVTSHVPVFQSAAPPWRKGFWITRLMSRLYPKAQCVATVSAGLGDELASVIGMPRAAIKTLYNPVITSQMRERMGAAPPHPWLLGDGPPVVCGCGSLHPRKGFDVLLRSFASLARERELRLIIVGEGRERARLEALARDLDVAQDVALVGTVANPLAYMARAQLFVLSSTFEGLPTVLIEALACGTPVVSTDCPYGPREILDEGRYGRLVPIGDHVALAEAIGQTLIDPSSATTLRERAGAFTAEKAADEYMRHLELPGRIGDQRSAFAASEA
jgi:glycosyltransferase involved in cell wall biosynthesis